MKTTTLIFIILQLLDVILTVVAVELLGFWELNPLGYKGSTFVLKGAVIIGASIILEKFNFGKLIYVVLAVPILVVIWNIFNIVIELIYR